MKALSQDVSKGVGGYRGERRGGYRGECSRGCKLLYKRNERVAFWVTEWKKGSLSWEDLASFSLFFKSGRGGYWRNRMERSWLNSHWTCTIYTIQGMVNLWKNQITWAELIGQKRLKIFSFLTGYFGWFTLAYHGKSAFCSIKQHWQYLGKVFNLWRKVNK